MQRDAQRDPGHEARGAVELRLRHQAHEIVGHRRQPSHHQQQHGHPIGGYRPKRLLGPRLFHLREVERRPRVLEGAQKELHAEPEVGADRVDADFAQGVEQAEDVPVRPGNDLVRHAMRQSRQSEPQALPEDLHREHRTDQRDESGQQQDDDAHRDDQIRQIDAEYAQPQRDDEQELGEERREIRRERQRDEGLGLALDAHDMKRQERQTAEKCGQKHELHRQRVSGAVKHAVRHEGRHGDARNHEPATGHDEEEEQRTGQPLTRGGVMAVVVVPHERRIDAPSVHDAQ